MPKINMFNGGLRIAQAPHLIKENESAALVSADHISGILTPMMDKVQAIAGAEKWGHYFTTDDTWYWSATGKDYVEFQERLYIGNRNGISTKIVSGTEYNLGIQRPTDVPTVVVTAEVPEQDQITRLDLLNGSTGGDLPDATTYRYKVVNIDATGKKYISEEEFTTRMDTGTATNRISVTCTDTNIDNTIAVFRFFDNYWRKIYEGAGSATILLPVFVDTVHDISANDDDSAYQVGGLKGTYQYALTFFNSIDGTESAPVLSAEFEVDWGTATVSNLEVATDPQVNQRKLYRIGGNSTAFTLVEILDNIVVSYIDSAKDEDLEGSLMQSEQNFPPVANLHWLMESYAMMFAADVDKLRFTPIGEPDYWPQTYFLDFPRPITGLAKTPIGILVFNTYETWLVTGTGPLSLTQQLLTGSQGCINGDTVVNMESSALWASTDGVCMSNGGQVGVITDDKMSKLHMTDSVNAIVYDERYHILMLELGTTLVLDLARQVIKYVNYDIRSLNKANDILYGYNDGYLYELEASTEPMLMQYSSPKYIGRGYTVPKTYKNFYMYSEGEVSIEIFIDDVLAQDVTHTTTGNHQVKIPTVNTRGYALQFHILGYGSVIEVQWEEGNANQ
jgi:hypothetical protein